MNTFKVNVIRLNNPERPIFFSNRKGAFFPGMLPENGEDAQKWRVPSFLCICVLSWKLIKYREPVVYRAMEGKN